MLKYAVEFVGTFVFLTAILMSTKQGSSMSSIAPLIIGIALIGCIGAFGPVSGGHFNPSVTAMFFAKGDIEQNDAIAYVVAQVAGGLAAYQFFNLSQQQPK
jgi:glycerol uptake facilitator-like aquaporin